MNDWILKALKGLHGEKHGEKKAGNEVTHDSLNKAFDLGAATARKMRDDLLEAAEPFVRQGKCIEATLTVFVAVWMNLAWAKEGVEKTKAIPGDNPVAKLWRIFEIGMNADGPEAAQEALTEWMKHNGKTDS